MTASLSALQRDMLAAVRGGETAAAVARLSPTSGIPVDTGLSIYRNAYGSRLREALENDHPVLGAYLGDELWLRMCDGYARAHPSRVRSLRHYGASLPEFLMMTEPFRDAPQIAEIASLERMLLDCFDAADAPIADWDALLSIAASAWPSLRIEFHPSVRVFEAACNSVEIWSVLKEGAPPPEAEERSTDWLLWRDHDRVTRFRSMSDDESLASFFASKGCSFAEICEALLAIYAAEEVPQQALSLLMRWCEDGVVSAWVFDRS